MTYIKMEEEYMEFKHWKTGEKRRYYFCTINLTEKKTKLICPFDDTQIIFWSDLMSYRGYECPNCGIDYSSIEAKTQESVDKEFNEYIRKIHKEISELDKRKKNLNARLGHIKTKNIQIMTPSS